MNEFERAVASLRASDAIGERGVILGRLLANLSWFYDWIGQSGKAMDVARESLDLLQRLGAREERLMPLLCLDSAQGSLEESNRLLRESLTLARECGDQWAIGHTLLRMGETARAAGDYEQAEQRGLEALHQFRQNGDTRGAAWVLWDLTNVAIDCGLYEKALALARETMSLSQGLNFVASTGIGSLGVALYALGAYEEAQDLLQQNLTIDREVGLRSWVSKDLFILGKIAFRTEDYARATQQYRESLAGALELDDLEMVALNHDALGRLNMIQGAGNLAREHLQTALQVALPLGRPPILLATLATVAELLAEEDDLAYAASLAMLVTNHPASQAKVKERAARLLTRLEAQLPANDLANIRRRSRQGDLDAVAAQLLEDLKTP